MMDSLSTRAFLSLCLWITCCFVVEGQVWGGHSTTTTRRPTGGPDWLTTNQPLRTTTIRNVQSTTVTVRTSQGITSRSMPQVTNAPPTPTSGYVEQRIIASFVAAGSFNLVADNLPSWTASSREAIASAAQVQTERITNVQLTAGSINTTFIIERSTTFDPITTDEAKDNLEAEVDSRRLVVVGPQSRQLSPDPGLTWRYTEDQATPDVAAPPTALEQRDDDDESGIETVHVIFIVCGAFIAVVIIAAGVATCCLTNNSKATPNSHYNDTYEEHIIAKPEQSPKLSERSNPEQSPKLSERSNPETDEQPATEPEKERSNSATFDY